MFESLQFKSTVFLVLLVQCTTIASYYLVLLRSMNENKPVNGKSREKTAA